MANLKLTDVEKTYAGAVNVLNHIDLDIQTGELVVFVGPSGCGKSTLLRMIAGLEKITGGTLEIDGQVVNDVPPSQRGIAMVFQSYALYPHMTVRENMSFALRIAKKPQAEIDAAVDRAAKLLQLDAYLDRLPKALSGGQRQRVAIGRAIVREPEVFLFDEPLSNLDAALRNQTRMEIARLHREIGATMIYVTHDQIEALTLATKIAVLKDGELQQFDTPDRVYNQPANTFVAGFMGAPPMNLVAAEIIAGDGGAAVAVLERAGQPPVHVGLPASRKRLVGRRVVFGLRPEAICSGPVGSRPDHAEIDVDIDYVEVTGADRIAVTNFTSGPFYARLPADADVHEGRRARLNFDRDKINVFDADTGARIAEETP